MVSDEIGYMILTMTLIFCTIYFNYTLSQKSKDLRSTMKQSSGPAKGVSRFHLERWKEEFKHPLVLNSEKKISI